MRTIDIKIGRKNRATEFSTSFPLLLGVSNIERHKCDIIFVHTGGFNFTGYIGKNRFNQTFDKNINIWDILKMFNVLPRKQKKQLKNSAKKQIQTYIDNY